MRHDLEKLVIAAGLRARGRSWVAISEALGVNERTARRWAELPEFKAEVERARGDLSPTPRVQEALGELVGSAKEGLLALSVGVGLGVLAELL